MLHSNKIISYLKNEKKKKGREKIYIRKIRLAREIGMKDKVKTDGRKRESKKEANGERE